MLFSYKTQNELAFQLKKIARLLSFSIFIILIFTGIAAEAEGTDDSVSANENKYEKLKVFSEVLSLIESGYVEKIENKTLIEGAIKGLVKVLDPHTSYMPPEAYEEMKVQTSGNFGGLGIEVSIRDDVLTGVSPIEGTPAFKAGIQAKDKIIKIKDRPIIS